jgi:hypothetical protein
MEGHIYKLLFSDGIFASECHKEYLAIVKAARGDSYAALHDILHPHHPRLTELIVEVKYLSQTVIVHFGEHVKLVQQYIDRESMCSHHYTRYEALQMVLHSLHVNFHVTLTKRIAEELGVDHDRVQAIPFTVHMYQIGASLSGWAKELGLHSGALSRLNFVDEARNSEIYVLPNGHKHCLCGQDGQVDQTCHRFANHVIGDMIMRENTTFSKEVVIANSTFITNAPRNKSMHTSSAVRQVTSSSTIAAPMEPPADAPLVSMISHPNVSHDTIAKYSNDDSSTDTVTRMVDYVQTIHLDPYDVLLGMDYNSNLLKEINANWDGGPLDSPAPVPTLTHVTSTSDAVPSPSDYG